MLCILPELHSVMLFSYFREDDCNVKGGYWKMRCNKGKTVSWLFQYAIRVVSTTIFEGVVSNFS